MTEQRKVSLAKSLDEEKRRATFVVLEPQDDDGTTTDLHSHWYNADEVAEGCYSFNHYCKSSDPNIFHMFTTKGFHYIESYIAPCEMELNGISIKKGSWLATLEVSKSAEHDWIWDGIRDGTFNGLSIQCNAIETEME